MNLELKMMMFNRYKDRKNERIREQVSEIENRWEIKYIEKQRVTRI